MAQRGVHLHYDDYKLIVNILDHIANGDYVLDEYCDSRSCTPKVVQFTDAHRLILTRIRAIIAAQDAAREAQPKPNAYCLVCDRTYHLKEGDSMKCTYALCRGNLDKIRNKENALRR